MLKLRSALLTALGASLNVNHAGPAGAVVVAVSVVNSGSQDSTPNPAIRIVGQFGNTDGSDIGGRGVENTAYVDIYIDAVDGPEWNAPLLLEDMHAALETAVRGVQSTLGASYFTITSSHRDFPPRQTEAGPYSYTRFVQVRGENLEKF